MSTLGPGLGGFVGASRASLQLARLELGFPDVTLLGLNVGCLNLGFRGLGFVHLDLRVWAVDAVSHFCDFLH